MRLTPSDIKLVLRNKESLSDKLDFLTDVQLETEDDYIFRLCEYFRWVIAK
jgi:hypothetical protein